jgi:hypothetical protein
LAILTHASERPDHSETWTPEGLEI